MTKNDNDDDTKKGFPYDMGFKSLQQMHAMIALVPLQDGEMLRRFEYWKSHDGSCQGLKRVLGIIQEYSDGAIAFETMQARDRWFAFLREEQLKEFREAQRELLHRYQDEARRLEQTFIVDKLNQLEYQKSRWVIVNGEDKKKET